LKQYAIPIARWLVVLAMPFFLGFTVITFIVSPWYPRWAYGRESFPPDRFGFNQEQRLDLALVAVDYLQRREPAEQVIFMLERQRLPGSDDPLYNDREIGHMLDVKHLTDAIRRLSRVATFLVAAGLAFLLAAPATRREGYKALWHGGLATVILLLAIALFILIGWDIFFVMFHQTLFPPGTWSFAYSDSLIRLFPEKFWFDLGVIVSGVTLLLGIVVAAIGYALTKWNPQQALRVSEDR
jgi:integral membrane protein (TIGR01906 family)